MEKILTAIVAIQGTLVIGLMAILFGFGMPVMAYETPEQTTQPTIIVMVDNPDSMADSRDTLDQHTSVATSNETLRSLNTIAQNGTKEVSNRTSSTIYNYTNNGMIVGKDLIINIVPLEEEEHISADLKDFSEESDYMGGISYDEIRNLISEMIEEEMYPSPSQDEDWIFDEDWSSDEEPSQEDDWMFDEEYPDDDSSEDEELIPDDDNSSQDDDSSEDEELIPDDDNSSQDDDSSENEELIPDDDNSSQDEDSSEDEEFIPDDNSSQNEELETNLI